MLRSFSIAGFDGTDHLDGLGPAQDATAYRQRVEADYRHAAADFPRVPNSAYEQALRDVRARIDPLLEHPLPR